MEEFCAAVPWHEPLDFAGFFTILIESTHTADGIVEYPYFTNVANYFSMGRHGELCRPWEGSRT